MRIAEIEIILECRKHYTDNDLFKKQYGNSFEINLSPYYLSFNYPQPTILPRPVAAQYAGPFEQVKYEL